MNNVDEYVDSIEGELQAIVVELRKIIIDLSPDFVEEIKWNVPTYSMHKMMCSIMAHKNHVNLQVFRGAELEAVKELLGTGKNMRHVKITKLSELNKSFITKILKQAISVDSR